MFFFIYVSSNLSNEVFQFSKAGYKYYTSYYLLKLLYKIHPVVWEGPCEYIVGVPSPSIKESESLYQGERQYILVFDTENRKQLQRMTTESGISVRGSYKFNGSREDSED